MSRSNPWCDACGKDYGPGTTFWFTCGMFLCQDCRDRLDYDPGAPDLEAERNEEANLSALWNHLNEGS